MVYIEHNDKLEAWEGREFCGHIEFEVKGDTLVLKDLQVVRHRRREGIATGILVELRKRYPDVRGHAPMVTGVGAAFTRATWDGLATPDGQVPVPRPAGAQ